MDNLIENLAPLFIEWQQFITNNTANSLFLATFVFFVGVLITAFLFKGVVSGLKRQLVTEKNNLKSVENKREELKKIQLHDAEQMASIQQKHDLIEKKLQAAEAKSSTLQANEQQLTNDLQANQAENKKLNQAFIEKNQVLATLQKEFDEQKSKLSKFVVERLKIDEIEKNAEQVSQESKQVQQQLQQIEVELKEKNQMINGLDKTGQVSKVTKEKIDGLNAQISQLKSEKNQISKYSKEVGETDYTLELENTVKQHDQQLMQFNKKLQSLITRTLPEVTIDGFMPENHEDEGFINKVLGMFSSLDKATTGITSQGDEIESSTKDEDVWQEHHNIIEQLTHQLIAEEHEKEAFTTAEKNRLLAENSISELTEKISEQNVDLNNEKEEALESIQQKLKGFYNKIVS